MDKSFATSAVYHGPIAPNWTLSELVAWLSDDSRQHDPELQRPLALIEAALTGAGWSRTPSTVSLIRSLTLLVPTHGAVAIAELVAPSRIRARVAQIHGDRCDAGAILRPQVA